MLKGMGIHLSSRALPIPEGAGSSLGHWVKQKDHFGYFLPFLEGKKVQEK